MQADSFSRINRVGSMLEASDLYVNRSGRLVLEDINFVIEKGEFVGIVGPNGGGKSTPVSYTHLRAHET